MFTSRSAKAIANKFFELAKNENKHITNMQLQKLVYIANGYCLAILDEALYYNNTHAWQFGPVVPSLYKALQKYGSNVVKTNIVSEDIFPNEPQRIDLAVGVWNTYKKYTGSQLSSLTHKKGTPWDVTWRQNQFGIIHIDLIKSYYLKLIEASS